MSPKIVYKWIIISRYKLLSLTKKMKEADSLLRLKASRLMITCKAGLDLGMS